MTIFWIGCALAALASLAAWTADYRSTPADKQVWRRLTVIMQRAANSGSACGVFG